MVMEAMEHVACCRHDTIAASAILAAWQKIDIVLRLIRFCPVLDQITVH